MKNKEALENYTKLWDETKDQIELISGKKRIKYAKDFMKIRFESDNNLLLGNNNYYRQVSLHECLYEYEYECENDSYSIAEMITFGKYYKMSV